MLITPLELRKRCFRFIKASLSEPDQNRKRQFAAKAVVLAQMAEQQERDAAWRDKAERARSENGHQAEVPQRASMKTWAGILMVSALSACEFGVKMVS